MSTVLTIAGFDPSSGAGVTADLAVFAAHGLFGTSCITALTVQNTLGVAAVHPVAGDVVRATLEHLWVDVPPVGIKIGMLGTAECVKAVVGFLDGLGEARPMVVLDPVLRSTSGKALLDEGGVALMRDELLPLVDWATPNVAELGVLAGKAEPGREEIAGMGRELQAGVPGLGLLVTGGHLERPDDLLLMPFDGVKPGGQFWLSGRRVETTATHGTGCALSSAFLSRMVNGDGPLEAARGAKHYVAEAMRRAVPIGHGHGPMAHLWPLAGLVR
ncbi:bifunctional hydroxymethylpyrimidine kinase/phosphomethylpyrimidine kinase [Granulicella sibirica]|uniref:hydroxymethylpyrimidine kinase n=1 Tax=Granulicella sibirica TaxID=2479048 RepID=A0A4Q0SZS1_9BACT|nr:bifunctional hydroxymethylpyrimidine kinase/phosphomethylpyrimidine kinase [Granulicella sibirica]RXH56823.1 Hydroxymethylpyrimidine phosphate kinase ThiD [Granulicella sibirica]